MGFKQLKYVIFAFICMCVTPLITHAECDYQRQAELSRLASNVQLAYVYSESGFRVIMTNLTSDLYAIDDYGQRINGGEEKTFDYSSGTISFDIYAVDTSCSTDVLVTKSITLPTLNVYSVYDECKQFPNFKYCQMWGDYAITDEQFTQELEEYKKANNSVLKSSDEGESTVLQIVLEIFENNAFMFIFFALVIVLMIIFIRLRKKVK